jgi:hypothetical protein
VLVRLQLLFVILTKPVEKNLTTMKLLCNEVVFVFLIGICCQLVNSESLDPLVTIPVLGQVRGSRMSSFNQREFLAFRGIPYAQPPVGELRFKVSSVFQCFIINTVC